MCRINNTITTTCREVHGKLVCTTKHHQLSAKFNPACPRRSTVRLGIGTPTVPTVRPKILDLLFHDDRMFVWEVTPVTSRDLMSFPTRVGAVAHYKRVVVQTPRASLGEKSPDPLPTLETYAAWLVARNLYDPVLNPRPPGKTDA